MIKILRFSNFILESNFDDTNPKPGVKLLGRTTTIHSDGTISIYSNSSKKMVRVRFNLGVVFGDVNIVNIEQRGRNYHILTKRGRNQPIKAEMITKIIHFIDSKAEEILIDTDNNLAPVMKITKL
jgi:uncharacterized protein YlaI